MKKKWVIIIAIVLVIVVFIVVNIPKIILLGYIKMGMTEEELAKVPTMGMNELDISNYTEGKITELDLKDIIIKVPYSNLKIKNETDGLKLYENGYITVGLMESMNVNDQLDNKLWYEAYSEIYDFTEMELIGGITFKSLGIKTKNIERALRKYDNVFELKKAGYSYNVVGAKKLNIFSNMNDITDVILKMYIRTIIGKDITDTSYFEKDGYNGFVMSHKNKSKSIYISKGNYDIVTVLLMKLEGKDYIPTENDVKFVINSVIKDN